MSTLSIFNASIRTPEDTIENGTIQIRDGRIETIGSDPKPSSSAENSFNAQGLTVAPGFIDLQLNGGFGKDFTIEPESIWDIAPKLLQYGVTSFLPTIISCPPENLALALQVINQGPPDAYRGPHVLGLHLEGPFLSKKGAHNPEYFQVPNNGTIRSWGRENGVRIVTLAPELDGAIEISHQLASRGVTVSAGHSNATYEQAKSGLQAGIGLGTHLFNAMSPLKHRDPGLVGALLNEPDNKVSIIADGIHVHPAAVALAMKLKGPNNLILVSDAMSALGMPPGEYPLMDETVFVDETSARLANGSLAGSILTLDTALRNLITFTGCSLEAAISTLTCAPAQAIAEPLKGKISAGYDADLVFLNQDLYPVATMVAGEILWNARYSVANAPMSRTD